MVAFLGAAISSLGAAISSLGASISSLGAAISSRIFFFRIFFVEENFGMVLISVIKFSQTELDLLVAPCCTARQCNRYGQYVQMCCDEREREREE